MSQETTTSLAEIDTQKGPINHLNHSDGASSTVYVDSLMRRLAVIIYEVF